MKRRDLIALLGGAAVARSLAVRAQQKARPVIGYLHFASPDPFAYQIAAFHQALGEAGYVEGKTVAIEYRWAEGHYERLSELAADLVDRKVDVIAAIGPPSAHAAKSITTTIPIVFTVGTDPVADGLVASLAHPSGNLTGIAILAVDLTPKRLELLAELVPQAKFIALLVNPNNAYTETMIQNEQEAAHSKGMRLQILKASSEREIDTAFADLSSTQADALVIGDDVFFTSRREQLVTSAARYRIPSIERWREFVVAGGLISYGPNLVDISRRLGIYIARILNGVKPADLPVEQSTKLELVINLKTAKALGLTVPQSLLARADEVIE